MHKHRFGRHARRHWQGEEPLGFRHSRWGRSRFGGARYFEQGDLRYVVLALVAEKPRHGYDIIKDIEERFGGAYSPSPGVIYPLLTMLEELGHVSLNSSEGGKKLYAVTPAGEAELKENDQLVSALFARMADVRDRHAGGRAPQIVRAMENLRLALRLKVEQGPVSEQQAEKIAAALDAATQAIERA
jgi:DNA-binding PadR family transcriptional regulator